MTGIPNQVYRALTALPCAVSRAWPQQPQPLPALSFSMLDYRAGERGLDRVTIRLSIRAALPEEADALAEQAAAALLALGLSLDTARDEAEADGGAFLKNLNFSGQALEGALVSLSLQLLVQGAWLPLAGLRQVSFTPARQEYLDIRALSAETPLYAPGEASPAGLALSASALPADPGQQALSNAFHTQMALDWRLTGGAFTQTGRALVSALEANALGFAAQLMMTP